MNTDRDLGIQSLINIKGLSEGEREELVKLELLSNKNEIQPYTLPKYFHERPPIYKHAVHVPHTLSEAYQYSPRPSSFSRALALEIGGYKIWRKSHCG